MEAKCRAKNIESKVCQVFSWDSSEVGDVKEKFAKNEEKTPEKEIKRK